MEEEWKQMVNSDRDLSLLIEGPFSAKASKDPIEKIKRSLWINGLLGVVIASAYVVIFFRFPVWQVDVCIGIVLAFTLWGSGKALVLLGKLKRAIPGNTVLQEMERHYAAVKSFITIQQAVGLVIYPFAVAGGFMIGAAVGAGKSIDLVMHHRSMVIMLVILVVLLVPGCFYLSRWMCHRAFGVYARQLKENIDRLRGEIE